MCFACRTCRSQETRKRPWGGLWYKEERIVEHKHSEDRAGVRGYREDLNTNGWEDRRDKAGGKRVKQMKGY